MRVDVVRPARVAVSGHRELVDDLSQFWREPEEVRLLLTMYMVILSVR